MVPLTSESKQSVEFVYYNLILLSKHNVHQITLSCTQFILDPCLFFPKGHWREIMRSENGNYLNFKKGQMHD